MSVSLWSSQSDFNFHNSICLLIVPCMLGLLKLMEWGNVSAGDMDNLQWEQQIDIDLWQLKSISDSIYLQLKYQSHHQRFAFLTISFQKVMFVLWYLIFFFSWNKPESWVWNIFIQPTLYTMMMMEQSRPVFVFTIGQTISWLSDPNKPWRK